MDPLFKLDSDIRLVRITHEVLVGGIGKPAHEDSPVSCEGIRANISLDGDLKTISRQGLD